MVWTMRYRSIIIIITIVIIVVIIIIIIVSMSSSNSKHWFTTSFLQPLPYLVTP